MPLLDELKKLVAERLGIDEKDIKPGASFTEDLGADSLDLVELMMALEEKFGIEIPDEDTRELVTVQDVIDYLKSKGIIGGD